MGGNDSDSDDWGLGSNGGSLLLGDLNNDSDSQRRNPYDNNDDSSNTDTGGDGQKTKMSKTLGFTGGIAIIMGVMIGSGIFASPGVVLARTNSVGLSLLAWAAAGVISLLGSLCYVELGTMIAQSGGEYTYIKLAYGKLAGFVYIWATVMITKPMSLAIICLVSGQYLVKVFSTSLDPPDWYATVVAIGILMTVTFVNSISVTCASRVNIVFTAMKLLALSSIGILGIIWICRDAGVVGTAAHTNFAHPLDHAESTLSSFGVATLAALWGFDGWNNLNVVVDEVKNPAYVLPRALLVAVSLVTTLYIVANIGYFAVMDLGQIVIVNTTTPVEGFATSFGLLTLGESGRVLLPLCIALSTFGAANASAFTGARLVQVSALDGDFPKFLSRLHGKGNPTPMRALIAQGTLGVIFLVMGNFESLLAGYSCVAWVFYCTAVTCVFYFRIKEPKRPRPFRVWLAIPIAFCLIAVILVIATFIINPYESLVSMSLTASAFPVYFIRNSLRKRGYLASPTEINST